MARHLRSAFTIAQSSSAGPSSLRPFLSQTPRPHHIAAIFQRREASNWLGGIGNYVDSWLRDQNKSSRPKATQATQPSSSSKPTSTAASITTSDASLKPWESGGIFDEVVEAEVQRTKKRYTEHRYKTARHKISPRKLNDLSRQIAGLPVDEAILQMQFSEKDASRWIKSTLALARDHAVDYKGLKRSRLVVAESWVSKARFGPKQLDIKGRGRRGVKRHPYARLNVLLKEGLTKERKLEIKFKKELGKVRSAGMVREDGKLRRKVISDWTW